MPSRTVAIPDPFDLGRTTRALGVGEIVDRAWVFATSTVAGIGTIAITRVDGGVHAEAWGIGADELLDRLPTLVGLDDPIWNGTTPTEIRDLDAESHGLRLGANGAMHETLVKAVLGQMVTTQEAKRSFRLLKSTFGAPAPGPFTMVKAFPDPSVIAGMSYEDLHRVGVEQKRAEIVIEVSRRGRRINESLTMPVADAWNRLLAIRGVGPWTAGLVMGPAYGDRDAVPIGDYHLANTIGWALGAQPRSDDARMLELLEPFRPYRRRILMMVKQAGIRAPKYGPRTAMRSHL